LVVVATAALAGAGTSTADDAAPQAVVSGHARFEVLSPTLIRMEYAGDDRFADEATFNAIGRDDFGHTAFTQSVADGWLTIATGKATLKYKVGSGPFTAQNVSLELKAGSQSVSAAPAFPPAMLLKNIEGTVAAQFIVDTLGRVDTTSFHVLESTHPDFSLAVRQALPGMRFHPAVAASHKVRQLVQQMFSFKILTPAPPAETAKAKKP
jgi:hypothetical protein